MSQSLSNRHNMNCTALDVGNAAVDLSSPRFLDLRILVKARQQLLRQRRAFAWGELQRFRLQISSCVSMVQRSGDNGILLQLPRRIRDAQRTR